MVGHCVTAGVDIQGATTNKKANDGSMSSAQDKVNELLFPYWDDTNGDRVTSDLIDELVDKTGKGRKYISTAIRRAKKKWRTRDVVETEGIDMEQVHSYWYKPHKGVSIYVKPKNGQVSAGEIMERLLESMKGHEPKYPKIERANTGEHLLVVDPADVHIGKLASAFQVGVEYDSQLAVQRVREGVKGLVDKAIHHGIDRVLFIGGNDILHVDNNRNSTTKGTPQETSGTWFDNFDIAKQLYVEVLEYLMVVADVHYIHCPSNHDLTLGYCLGRTLEAWFRNSDNISFDCGPSHRKYYEYGSNCIGVTHGDGAKAHLLPQLMAEEAGSLWLNKHRYIYTHHVHHKVAKDYGSVCVESLRSPSGTDSWHHVNGYQHQPKAIEAFLHSKDNGQVGRFTHLF